MSSGDENDGVVRQKKDGNAPVCWVEYDALRDHLTRQFSTQCDRLQADLTATDIKVDNVLQTATESAAALTAIQNSIGALNRAVQVLTQRNEQPVDDASVHGDHGVDFDAEEDDEQAAARRERLQRQQQPQPHANGGRGGGRGGAIPPGRGFAPLGLCPLIGENVGHAANRDDDGVGKPKFTIPMFEGSVDVEEYINWELKMDQLWRLHDYTEDRKIKLASSEFELCFAMVGRSCEC